MSLEKHHNKTYYYRNRRINGRQVKEYLGSGEKAQQLAEQDARRRAELAAKRAALRAEQAEFDRVERELDELEALLEPLIVLYMESLGYHKHRGQWRKRRVKKQKDTPKGV
jgi:hypothetical protein